MELEGPSNGRGQKKRDSPDGDEEWRQTRFAERRKAASPSEPSTNHPLIIPLTGFGGHAVMAGRSPTAVSLTAENRVILNAFPAIAKIRKNWPSSAGAAEFFDSEKIGAAFFDNFRGQIMVYLPHYEQDSTFQAHSTQSPVADH